MLAGNRLFSFRARFRDDFHVDFRFQIPFLNKSAQFFKATLCIFYPNGFHFIIEVIRIHYIPYVAKALVRNSGTYLYVLYISSRSDFFYAFSSRPPSTASNPRFF